MEELDFRLHVIFLKRWRIYIFFGGEGKEGKYLEKEKIFGEEKIFVEEEKRRRRRKIFGEEKNIFWEEKKNGEGKGGKYLENQNSRDGWTRTG